MSRETLEYHYEQHHRGYLAKLQRAIANTPQAAKSLEDVLLESTGAVFQNAAQVWNHTFFWNCMAPGGGGEPGGEIGVSLREAFGSFDVFRQAFLDAGVAQFGSGYVWLVLDRAHSLRVVSTANADNPLTLGQVPLLTCDLWEHAYYLDHRNRRAAYVDAFLRHLVDWDQVGASLQEAA